MDEKGFSRVKVSFYDAQTGKLQKEWALADGSASAKPPVSYHGTVELSPDGQHLLVCCTGKPTASVWDLASQQVVWSANSPKGFTSGAFSLDGKFLAVSSADAEVQLLTFPECKVVSVGKTPWGGMSVSFSPDSKSLLVRWENNKYREWGVDELLMLKTWGAETKGGKDNAASKSSRQ